MVNRKYLRGLMAAGPALAVGLVVGLGACSTIEKGGVEFTADPDSAEEADAIEDEMGHTDPGGAAELE